MKYGVFTLKYKIYQLKHQDGTVNKTAPSPINHPKHDIAIIIHLFYLDVWEEIVTYLQELTIPFDLYITIPEGFQPKEILGIWQHFPHAHLYMVENRGRDVLPFLHILQLIGRSNYTYLCKLHTKKSVTSHSGNAWRKLLYYDLIGSPRIAQENIQRLDTQHKLGIITGKNLILDAVKFDLGNSSRVKELASLANIPYRPDYHFAAGTMFWARVSLFQPLQVLMEKDLLDFEEERGQSDHTLAHALERFFGLLCHNAKLELAASYANYQELDRHTLEELAILAFTQRFEYDLRIHGKNLLIHEKDKMLHNILTSKSYRFTKPFRDASFLFETLLHFKLEKINSHGTNEHKLAMAIKRRIPERLFWLLKRIIKKRTSIHQKGAFWNHPLTTVSDNRGNMVAIIAELSIPQCKKYRVDQKVEMLQLLGYQAQVVSWTEYHQARNILQLANLVFFYRVPAEPSVISLVEESQRLGLQTIFDVDDLIFDEALLKKNINIQRLPKKTQAQVFAGAKTYKKAMSSMHFCSASTTILAEYMNQHTGHQSFILPNALDNELLSLSKLEKPLKDDSIVTIVYGSGTSTHDIDFQEVAEALAYVLSNYPHIRLVIHGTLTLPETLQKHKQQIQTIPFMEASEYYRTLNSYDINIAPLEASIFNDAKSNIKYLEASMLKLPTIASPVAEYKKVIQHGKNGLLASSTQEWIDAFEKLITSASLRKQIGEAAFNTVMKEYTVNTVAQKHLLPIVTKLARTSKKRQKHIMMVNVLFKPTSFGGATIVVEELSKRIQQRKNYDVTIVTAFFDTEKKLHADYDIVRYETEGLPVILIRLPEPMLSTLEYRNEEMQARFYEILKATKPDLVHFHAIQQLSASITHACTDLHIPYVITLHDMWWICERQFMLMPDGNYCHQTTIDPAYCQAHCSHKSDTFTQARTDYLKQILQEADLLLTPSRFQYHMYSNNLNKGAKLNINRNGIVFPASNYTKKEHQIVTFAYVGGNANHKGFHFLKEIFEQITHTDYELVVVDLERKLGHNSIFASDWHIGGNLRIVDGYENTQEGMDAFYSDIDVLLFPSQCKESFGLTVREAMARDVWVISTDAGGVTEEIVEGENGNIVAMHDKLMFQQHIERYIENYDTLKQYQNPHKHKIRTFDEQTAELLDYYHEIWNRQC